MTDWYYHDPAQGRVGPLSAEQMRARYRERRIQSDTLAWHQDLREWQSLERLSEELGLHEVRPDSSLPPPLPPRAAAAASASTAPNIRANRLAQPRPAAAAQAPRGGLSGCAIVAIVLAVLAVPVIGILAAIAIPAYQDYTVRARVMQVIAEAEALKAPVDAHIARHDRCPGNSSPGFGPAEDYATPLVSTVRIGELVGGACAIELQFRGLGAGADGQTLTFEFDRHAAQPQWHCRGGSLPAKYRPSACR